MAKTQDLELGFRPLIPLSVLNALWESTSNLDNDDPYRKLLLEEVKRHNKEEV
jgi:hypothetical protein